MRQHSFNRKKMAKQLTGKRDDTPLHLAARSGDLEQVVEIISEREDAELKELLYKQNHSGETALYVAVECGFVDIVKEIMKYNDISMAAIKAKNGYDAFHVASKQGNLGKSLPKVFKLLFGHSLCVILGIPCYLVSCSNMFWSLCMYL